MTETLEHGYSPESAQRKLFNEYQLDRADMVSLKSLRPCALRESIGRINIFL